MRRLILLLVLAGCESEEPRGSFVFRPELGTTRQALEPDVPILYLNRCTDGCTIYPGAEDSRTNHSSIVDEVSTVSPFPHDDLVWDQMFRCVQELYEPFEIHVTDEDPGDVQHIESIVAGFPEEIGMSGIGGVSPFACGIIPNGINFNFAALTDHPLALCNVVGQESGHTLGMDHQLLCDDPMTYLPSCGEKEFRRVDAECGEFEPRECFCGGRIQNSYLWLHQLLGPRRTPVDYAPLVEIIVPRDKEWVEPRFRVFAEVDEDHGVDRVELFIDGDFAGTSTSPPYGFLTPADFRPATDEPEEHELMVRAYDDTGQDAEHAITVTLVPPFPRPDAGFFDTGPNPGRRPRAEPDAGVVDSGAVKSIETDSGCTCVANTSRSSWWLLAGLLLLRRRR